MADITQICAITKQPFVVTEWEQALLEKMGVPLPTLCIEERHRRRLAHRNERCIYPGVCGMCEKKMISLYAPDTSFTVYCQECWWSDRWDPFIYEREFDFSRPFFEQFDALRRDMPRLSLMNEKAENSEYCNMTTGNRNCYLVFGGDKNEDCAYSVFNFYCKNVCDTYFVTECELCYEITDCQKCYRVMYAQDAYGCRDSAFLYSCRGLQDCFGCVNLRNKRFYIFNEPYSEEAYREKLRSFGLNTWSGVQKMQREFEAFRLQSPHPFAYIVNSEVSSGDHILNSKHVINCFDVFDECEDLKDCMVVGSLKDSLSLTHAGHKAELFYEMLGSITGYNCQFSITSWGGINIQYGDMVVNNCRDLFGCSQLRQAQYCILNKQYAKEAYEDLRERIISHMEQTGEWGEFLPAKYSLFAYNETVANDYFPRTKEQILREGGAWRDEETRRDGGDDVSIPDSVSDVSDDIVRQPLTCMASGRPYKITSHELSFYRAMGIPVPRHAPETRNQMRFNARPPRRLWNRGCMKCATPIQTPFAPERPEIIYCEKCYLEEVY